MRQPSGPAIALPARGGDQFLPKIITVWREGYGLADLRADALAGLTVAIVALPLSMAIAIASGVGPERGLFTTIIGGFLVSALGGSRFQIGGPAGAFIVLMAECVAQTGVKGLALATILSGFMLLAIGALRLGTYIKFIPYPVTVGFTAGIGTIIFASQIKDLFGLTLLGPEPAAILAKLPVLWAARASLVPAAVMLAICTIATILLLRKFRPHWPGMLIAVAAASAAAALLDLPVQTIHTKFGDLPRVPPMPGLPMITPAALWAALPYAVSFTLLGAIESLLSAVVADGMSGRRHRSNMELVGQGVANIGAALFGGFCTTGTIARTATNVRAGSHGPVSGMLHALFVLLFMLIAAPLAGYIPLAALAGVLAIVAWNMIERSAIWALLRTSSGDALVLITTFLLVVFRDLTEGIVTGFALGGVLFIKRMSEQAQVTGGAAFAQDDRPDDGGRYTPPGRDDPVVVYRIRGAFFFGAASTVAAVLDAIADRPRAFVVDFAEVPFMDSTAAHAMEMLARKLDRQGGRLYLTGTTPDLRRLLQAQGVTGAGVTYAATVEAAVAEAHAALAS